MSMKIVLVAAASVMAVTPAFAMSKSAIVNHTGGPIPYSQLVSMDKSGYNARSHRKHKKTSTSDQSVAANTTTSPNTAATLGDQNAAPSPSTSTPAGTTTGTDNATGAASGVAPLNGAGPSNTTTSGANGSVGASPGSTTSTTPGSSNGPPSAGGSPQ